MTPVPPRRLIAIHRRIERRLGEMLREVVQHGGNRRSRCPEVTLKSLGVSKKQSCMWQRLAEMSDDAQRLMQIASNPALANATHVSLLPPSWGTLYELSRL